jgi:hypothetical protein
MSVPLVLNLRYIPPVITPVITENTDFVNVNTSLDNLQASLNDFVTTDFSDLQKSVTDVVTKYNLQANTKFADVASVQLDMLNKFTDIYSAHTELLAAHKSLQDSHTALQLQVTALPAQLLDSVAEQLQPISSSVATVQTAHTALASSLNTGIGLPNFLANSVLMPDLSTHDSQTKLQTAVSGITDATSKAVGKSYSNFLDNMAPFYDITFAKDEKGEDTDVISGLAARTVTITTPDGLTYTAASGALFNPMMVQMKTLSADVQIPMGAGVSGSTAQPQARLTFSLATNPFDLSA